MSDSGELCDGGVLEDKLRGDDDAGLLSAGDDLDGEDGVTAELEEVVEDADGVDVEDIGPDGGEGGFGGVARRGELVSRCAG